MKTVDWQARRADLANANEALLRADVSEWLDFHISRAIGGALAICDNRHFDYSADDVPEPPEATAAQAEIRRVAAEILKDKPCKWVDLKLAVALEKAQFAISWACEVLPPPRDVDRRREAHATQELDAAACDDLIREFGAMTSSKVAVAMGCTRQRVDQIEAIAKAKIRARMTPDGELSRAWSRARGVSRFSADSNDDELEV